MPTAWTSWCVMAKPCGAPRWRLRTAFCHRFVAQVTGGPQRATEHPGAGRRADPGGCPANHPAVFQWCLEQGADVLLTVKSNQKTLYRQIGSLFQGKRRIPFTATDQEEKHARDTLWEHRAHRSTSRRTGLAASGLSRWLPPPRAAAGSTTTRRHLFLTSIRTTPDALLRLIRQRWSNCFSSRRLRLRSMAASKTSGTGPATPSCGKTHTATARP